MSQFKLLTLPPSPNNVKVRLALKLKGLDYETQDFDFSDRTAVIEASGQPLTPVLLDGERTIYDSFGILRYLDANWPEPRLFSDTREGQQEIQQWERFAAAEAGATLGQLLGSFLSGEDDPEVNGRVQARFDELPKTTEEALADSPYLGGETPNAADLTVAPFFAYTVLDAAELPEGSPQRFVAERVQVSQDFPKTRDWVRRVMAIDEVPAGQKAAVATA